MIRRPISVLSSLAVLALVLGRVAAAVPAAAQDPAPGGGPWNLTIFHTNDTHSAFLPRPAAWRDDGRMVGGVIALAWHLADQRRLAGENLLLDGGDFMTGNPVCLLAQDGVPGVAIARMMSGLGYDAGVIGNHEFDVGAELASRLVPLFSYPLFGGDIVDAEGLPAFRREPIIFERGGLKVGVFGFSCTGMAEVVTAAKLGGLHMAAQAALAREIAARLDPDTDLIILITHNGVDGDKALAQELTGAGIDVIVGGHSHTRLKQPVLANGILIVQAGGQMTNLGRLDLQVADDRVVSYDGRLIDLWSDGTFADEDLNAMVAGYENSVMNEYGRQIGTLVGGLSKGEGEHNLGNWLADCLRSAADADVGLINGGGIRKPLQAGPITALDITELLPFANNLVRLNLSGTQLATVVQQNANAGVSGNHGILQVSGLRYTYRAAADGVAAVVGDITVGGEPLDPARVYRVAMPDFVTMMNDVYLKIELPPVEDLGVTLATAVIAVVEKTGRVSAQVDGRITRTD
jgi:2',3'-cyclic-nucleotide 2'-phosphodiesterase (5'-nucleotidase family)